MKAKKLNRYQKKIKNLEALLAEANNEAEYRRRRYDELYEEKDKEIKRFENLVGQIEGRESPVLVENEWLKETLSLIIIPADKLKQLDELRQQRMKNRF